MSNFRPTRASPPSKPVQLAAQVSVSDASRSSAVSIPELLGLTPHDIDFLDDVIERAGLSATTFLTVFKAYNDVLHDRGLDPQDEVVYYGKLLKLGTLKGRNWGDKWNLVKLQQGYNASLPQTKTVAKGSNQPARATTRFNARLLPCDSDNDTFTLHSHQDDTERSETDADTENGDDIPQYHLVPRRVPRRSPSPLQTTTIAFNGHAPLDSFRPSSPQPYSMPPIRTRKLTPAWDAEASDATEINAGSPSTTPPSYRTVVRDTKISEQLPYIQQQRTRPKGGGPVSVPVIPPSKHTRSVVTQVKEGGGNLINEDEAWNKIRMSRDEKEADRFREERLFERCWDVWKEGFHWIITTNEQIGQARDTLLIRLSLQRWRNLTASRKELSQRVTTLANNRCLRAGLNTWKAKLKSKRQTKWRNGMRTKMKNVREKREGKLRKDAWAKWRQSYRSHLSGQHYTERLVLKCFQRWNSRLAKVDRLENAADQSLTAREERDKERCWEYWKRAAEIRGAERVIAERVGLRIMGNAMDVWQQRSHDNHTADVFHDVILKKGIIRSWKTARDRIRVMEHKASKHLARQDDVLMRAVARVWKARERGQLLERVKAARLLKDAWAVWKKRIQQHRQLEHLALSFSTRSNAYTVSSALQIWRQVHTTHRNALSFAVHYRSAQLQFKMLLAWRLQLRERLKMMKKARIAERFFVARIAWMKWAEKLEERRREKKLKDLERGRLRDLFNRWLRRAQRHKQRRVAEQAIHHRVTQRILKNALSQWTNRVIERKLHEFEVAQQNELALVTFAFKKWKGVCIRHVEELSLMESYQDVKREENISRMFHRWLSAARATRHRRITLQQKEDEIRRATIAISWDKWRDRFSNEKLRSVEYTVIFQSQRNLMFRTFGIWHSKTKSLPAIRFHASHAKAKFWEKWRSAMPRALQAREAREIDKKAILSKALEKWLQTYRTKIALKAVARARYLRLPTATPRQVIPPQRPAATSALVTPRSIFPRRKAKAESVAETDESDAGPSRLPLQSRPLVARAGIASLLIAKPQSEVSPPRLKFSSRSARETSPARSKSSFGHWDTSPPRLTRQSTPSRSPFGAPTRETRDTSPTRSRPPSSSGGGEAHRSRLWVELREVQRKSRPTTERSRSREPP